jgi:hypothetical protein
VGVMGFSTAGVERMRIDASGYVTTTTQSITDSSTKLATTAFVVNYTNGTALTLTNGTTATTQTAGDATTKLATTAFVNNTALTLAANTTAVTQSAGNNTTKVATTAFVNGTALTLTNGTTATTQAISDATTKVATTAFVGSYANGTALTLTNGTTATTQAVTDNTTKVATTAFSRLLLNGFTSSNVGTGTYTCTTLWKSHTITLTETRYIYAMFTGIWQSIGNSNSYAQMYLDGVAIPGAKLLMEQIKNGTSPYHFIEVMGCPGGCITGGGQPRSHDTKVKEKRMSILYAEDENKHLRQSHENPSIQKFYDLWGSPGCYKSHEYLHTYYVDRSGNNN